MSPSITPGIFERFARVREMALRLSPERVAADPRPRTATPARDQTPTITRTAALSAVVIVSALGDHPDASEEAYRAALDTYRPGRDGLALLRLHSTITELRSARGDLPGARAALERAEAVAAELGEGAIPIAYLLIARGAVRELEGSAAEARAIYLAAAEAADKAGARYAWTKASLLAAHLSTTPEIDAPIVRQCLQLIAREGYRDFLQARPALTDWLRDQTALAELRPGDVSALELYLRPIARKLATVARPGGLEIGFLGGLTMRHNGRMVADRTWRTAKAKELLALLVMSRGRFVDRDKLMESLWPDSDRTSSISKFHFTLHALRRELGAAGLAEAVSISHRDRGYRAELADGAVVDVDVFAVWIARAQEAKSKDDAAGRVAALREAVALYRGRLLPELGGVWVEQQREIFERGYVSVARELARLELASGNASAAAQLAQALLALEPYAEDVHRILLQAYRGGGDDALAVRHYAALEKLLRDELDVEPEAETRELVAGIGSRAAARALPSFGAS